MPKTPRKLVRASQEQINVLVDYMLTHHLFANGEFKGPLGNKTQDAEWAKLKSILDNHGPDKSIDQWKCTWRDLKKKAREDNARSSRASNETGNTIIIPKIPENSLKILGTIGFECSTGCGVEESPVGIVSLHPVELHRTTIHPSFTSTSNPSTFPSPSTSLPSTSDPSTFLPSTSYLSTSLPSTSNPSTSLPSTSDPSKSLPSTSDPSKSLPSTPDPSTSLPSTPDPSTSLPSTTTPQNSFAASRLPSSARRSNASNVVPHDFVKLQKEANVLQQQTNYFLEDISTNLQERNNLLREQNQIMREHNAILKQRYMYKDFRRRSN